MMVGKKTSIRRDCDSPSREKKSDGWISRKEDLNQKGLRPMCLRRFLNERRQERRPQLEGIATARASRDFSKIFLAQERRPQLEGIATQLSSIVLFRSLMPQERRPQLEGIATRHEFPELMRLPCRKEDLNQKGLRPSSQQSQHTFFRRKEDLNQKGLRHIAFRSC